MPRFKRGIRHCRGSRAWADRPRRPGSPGRAGDDGL